MDLILEQSPFSHSSVDDLDRIERAVREALPADLREESSLYFAGTTASVRDLAAVMQRDRTRIAVLVLASVFVILVLLLRRFVVPLYLLVSVLFSYYYPGRKEPHKPGAPATGPRRWRSGLV